MAGNRIAILTLHWSNNYGACYQAYALQAFLKESGYQPQIIDYRMESVGISKILARPITSLKKINQKKIISAKGVKNWFQRRIPKSNSLDHRDLLFNRFRRDHLPISDKRYLYEDLKDIQDQFDAFIVGSDQVWAADFEYTSDAYILGFVDRKSYKGKLLSYAASFGKSSLEPYLRDIFKAKVSHFDAISCRETSGCEIVQGVVGRNASKVVDPTLLISNYSPVTSYKAITDTPYMLVYVLPQEASLSQRLTKAIAFYSEKKQLNVKVVAPEGCDPGLESYLVTPTPEELLGLFQKASLLITNSFHGTVFGLIFEVPFAVFARDSYQDKQNVRMTELLTSVGLYGRFVEPDEDYRAAQTRLEKPISFVEAKESLARIAADSRKFLLSSLAR